MSGHATLLWAPRVLGVVVALFLGTFALDAFSPDRGFWASLPAFLVHLAPTLVLLTVVALAWSRPALGAIVFLGLALLYALATIRHADWIFVIAGPLALVGALYYLSWVDGRASTA